MAVYGDGTKYGSGAKYGFDVAPGSALDLRRQIYGGWAPWLPDNRIAWRTACPTLWRLEGGTGTGPFGQQITGLAAGSDYTWQAQGLMLPTGTLNLQIADPTGRYLENGADYGLLGPGELLGVQWVVTTPAGSLTREERAWRVTQAPTVHRDVQGRDVLRVVAEDWLRAPLGQPLGGVTSPLASDSPLVVAQRLTNATGWSGIVGGLYAYLAGVVSTPAGSGLSETVLSLDDQLSGLNDWTAGGRWPTYEELLRTIQSTFGWAARYEADGSIALYDSDFRRDSGYVVSCDAAVGGAFPVPWQQHTRNPTRAPYTRVEVWFPVVDPIIVTDPGPPPVTTGTGAAVSYYLAGSAPSASAVNPHTPPLSRTEIVVAPLARGVPVGGPYSLDPDAGRVATQRLREYLGAADPLSLTVEPACPAPQLGDDMLIAIPGDDIHGMWAVQGYTAPLSAVDFATWQLAWRQDLSPL